MYHPTVIEHAIAEYEREHKQKLLRIDAAQCREWSQDLEDKQKNSQPLTGEDWAFIRNERVMTTFDFLYWAERYATIQADGGGICTLKPWGSQKRLMDKIAERELYFWEAERRGELTDGILICMHKARQLGATAFGRCWLMHAELKKKYCRGMSASVDDDKIMEMYDRDKLIYDNLPFWQKPELKYDEKGEHIYFQGIESRMLYQTDTQKTGLGVGRQFDKFHLTECSTWSNPEKMIELDFMPTLPRSRNVIGMFESTAFGRGNWWHEFTESVRNGGQPRWVYLFIPWYSEEGKYAAQSPVDWQPDKVSLLHAQKCHDTSNEFLGRTVMLSKNQLYWWESTRKSYMEKGLLNFFLTNWCATPEESFQHSGQAPFDADLIEQLRLESSVGEAYEFDYAPQT